MGAVCSLYNINEVIIQTQKYIYIFFSDNWINKLFSEENKVPRTLFEARNVAGSATYKDQFVFSVMKTKTVCLFSLCMHKKKISQ